MSDMESSSYSIEGVIDQASSWLSTCTILNNDCSSWGRSNPTWLPTRLLDISDATNSGIIRMFCPQAVESLEYAILSHRWETDGQLGLSTVNFESFVDGIPLKDLSKTFQETIMMCGKLQNNFIWINTLCILQYSREYWLRKSSMMRRVYIHVKICIVASGAADGRRMPLSSRNPLLVKSLLRRTTKILFDRPRR